MAIGKACRLCGKVHYEQGARCADCAGRANQFKTGCAVCGKLGQNSYCADHLPEEYGGPRSSAERLRTQPWRRGYRDPNYHRERQAALNRARRACERCGRSDIKLEVDHIVPLSTARDLDEVRALNNRSNLQVLCVMCHRAKTSRRR